jgi:hypothetical protein
MQYPAKLLSRAASVLHIPAGAHAPTSAARAASGISCWHAPLRSRQVLDARAEHGRRLIEAGYPPAHGWHNQRWHRLETMGQLDEEWNCNSARHGCLQVGERRTPLVFDPRLSDAVRPWASTMPSVER